MPDTEKTRIGIQSFSFRNFSLKETLKSMHKLKMQFIEPYPDHFPMTADVNEIQGTLKMMQEFGIQPVAYGVVGFDSDAVANRKVFEFAQQAGIGIISADPKPEAFESLEKLVAEFNIKIAIHNHGPGSRYDSLADLQQAIDGRHPGIGACVDTGHFIRSGEDPVAVINALKQRVHSLHLKDIIAEGDCIFGTGKLDVNGVLQAGLALDPQMPMLIEYEASPEDPFDDIQQSLEFIYQ